MVTGPVADTSSPVEAFVDGDILLVRAEMPGIDPERDVEIIVSDDTLHLQAARHPGLRSFSRSIPLPAGAREDDIEARYCDGILEVRLPVDSAKWSSRTIPVQRS